MKQLIVRTLACACVSIAARIYTATLELQGALYWWSVPALLGVIVLGHFAWRELGEGS